MKFTLACLFIVVAVSSVTYGLPGKGSTKPALKKKPCMQECEVEEYKPVCAGEGTDPKENRSFGNGCVLSNYNCENGKDWKIQSQGECPGGGGVRLS